MSARIRFIEPFVWAVHSRSRTERFGLDWDSPLIHMVYLEPREVLKRERVVTHDGRCIEVWEERVEPYHCTCEAALYHGQRPCFHVLEVMEYILRLNDIKKSDYIKRAAYLNTEYYKNEQLRKMSSGENHEAPKTARIYRLPPIGNCEPARNPSGDSSELRDHRRPSYRARRASGVVA